MYYTMKKRRTITCSVENIHGMSRTRLRKVMRRCIFSWRGEDNSAIMNWRLELDLLREEKLVRIEGVGVSPSCF